MQTSKSEEPKLVPQDQTFEALYLTLQDSGQSNDIGVTYLDANQYEKAYRWFAKAKLLGSAMAYRNLGLLYEDGHHLQVNTVYAAVLYLQALQLGVADAKLDLERLRENNTDDTEALQIARICEVGGVQANLGYVAANINEAMEWYNIAMEADNALAYFSQGCLFESQQNYILAAKRFLQANQRGLPQGRKKLDELFALILNGEILNNIGIMCISWDGIYGVETLKCDPAEAMKWMQKAIGQNCPVAYRNLGYLFANGLGVERNVLQAATYYAIAWHFGFSTSVNDLQVLRASRITGEEALQIADIFYSGNLPFAIGKVNINLAEAMKWYKRSSHLGNAIGHYNYAVCFENGYGVQRKIIRAAKLYLQAFQHNNPQGIISLNRLLASDIPANLAYKIANWFHYGENLPLHKRLKPEPIEAMKWYLKAIQRGKVAAIELFNQLLTNINDVNHLGLILLQAVKCKNRTVIHKLINKNANLNLPGDDNALCQAIKDKNFDIAWLLVCGGANYALQNNQTTALELLSQLQVFNFSEQGKDLLSLLFYLNDTNEALLKRWDANFRNSIRTKRDLVAHHVGRLRRKIGKFTENQQAMISTVVKHINSANKSNINKEVTTQFLNSVWIADEMKPLIRIIAYGVYGIQGRLAENHLSIIVDPARGNINQCTLNTLIDPAVGAYYYENKIYIAGLREVNEAKSQQKARGTLFHEFCHYALLKVFDNACNPYYCDDAINQQRFTNICNNILALNDNDELFRVIYPSYEQSQWHAELIVRVPQLIAEGRREVLLNKPEYLELLQYYQEVVVSACQDYLSNLSRIANLNNQTDIQPIAIFERRQPAQLTSLFFTDRKGETPVINESNTLPQELSGRQAVTASHSN